MHSSGSVEQLYDEIIRLDGNCPPLAETSGPSWFLSDESQSTVSAPRLLNRRSTRRAIGSSAASVRLYRYEHQHALHTLAISEYGSYPTSEVTS